MVWGMIDPLDISTLAAARKAASLTRGELAARAGVSETTIMRIEKGEVDPRLNGTWRLLVLEIQKATPKRRRPTAQAA